MNPFDPEPPGGDGRRQDRLLVWAATAGALGCSVLIFLLTSAQAPEPVAEPIPPLGTAWPAASTTTSAAPATTSATTTVAPPATTTPVKTTTKPATTTHNVVITTTTTTPAPTSSRRCLAASWQQDTAYDGGAMVAFGGRLWVAKWWNYNSVPGANTEGVWEPAQRC